MKVAETITRDLCSYLNNMRVLEIACGNAEFSMEASKYAKEVLATDISLERVQRKNLCSIAVNIQFKRMNAIDLNIEDNSFDITVCYNALGHLERILPVVISEMSRVTMKNGCLMFIATWKMDKKIISELKNIISRYKDLTIFADIENSFYKAIIIKKRDI